MRPSDRQRKLLQSGLERDIVGMPSVTRVKLVLFRAIVIIGFVGLSLQLFNLQVVQGTYYQKKADDNRLRLEPIKPARGVVYDRNGEPLARNNPSFTISIVPADLPRGRAEAVYARLGEILGISPAEIGAKVDQGREAPFTPVVVAANADRDRSLIAEESRAELPGVRVEMRPVRYYPYGAVISPWIGYPGQINKEEYDERTEQGARYYLDDAIGKAGLELFYERELRGSPGMQQAEVDASGRIVNSVTTLPPVGGHNLVLSIDLGLQIETTAALAEEMAKVHATAGAAVAINPQTGQVLAMVSLPNYDPNLFAQGIPAGEWEQLINDPGKPLLDRAAGDTYPPGSVFKPVVASAALEERVVTRDTVLDAPPYLSLQGWIFRDWNPRGFGKISMIGALAQSSDVYFYQVGGGYGSLQGLGPERIARYAHAFGLGEKLGIDIPGEADGVIPTPDWKQKTWGEQWYGGDNFNMSIGQGYVLVTPLGMANAIATIANGGKLYQPQVVSEITDDKGNIVHPFEKKLIREVPVSPENLRTVQEGMAEGVRTGTSFVVKAPDMKVAGKTGTAEVGDKDPHAWWVGFAPTDNPQIAIAVVVLHGGQGSEVAAPVGRRILRSFLGLPPDPK